VSHKCKGNSNALASGHVHRKNAEKHLEAIVGLSSSLGIEGTIK